MCAVLVSAAGALLYAIHIEFLPGEREEAIKEPGRSALRPSFRRSGDVPESGSEYSHLPQPDWAEVTMSDDQFPTVVSRVELKKKADKIWRSEGPTAATAGPNPPETVEIAELGPGRQPRPEQDPRRRGRRHGRRARDGARRRLCDHIPSMPLPPPSPGTKATTKLSGRRWGPPRFTEWP